MAMMEVKFKSNVGWQHCINESVAVKARVDLEKNEAELLYVSTEFEDIEERLNDRQHQELCEEAIMHAIVERAARYAFNTLSGEMGGDQRSWVSSACDHYDCAEYEDEVFERVGELMTEYLRKSVGHND